MKAFEITMIPDMNMVPAICQAVVTFAENFFEKKDAKKIGLATEEAIVNVLTYSMSSTLKEIKIGVEAEDGDFIVSVYDEGLPGDYTETLKGEETIGLDIMQSVMDAIDVENLGVQGRCQKLTKYYSKMPDFMKMKSEESQEPITDAQITVRKPRKDEMLEICRRLYGEYGMTYSHDDIYYPDKFYAEVAKDQVHSIVAVDENDNIAGHHASWNWTDIPGIWESGMAVVDSRYRGCGIFGKMMDVTRDYVVNQKKARVFISIATTFHTATQKLRLKIGDSSCGFFLSSSAADLMHGTFLEVNSRASFAMACSVLDKSPKTIYCPEEIVPFISKVYDEQQSPREYVTEDLAPVIESTKNLSTSNKRNKSGRIIINQVGADFERQFKTEFHNMRRQNAEIVELAISMDNPGTVALYNLAKQMGFFFEGFYPCADAGDMMFMVRPIAEPINYDAIQTTGPFTENLAIIKTFDPEQK